MAESDVILAETDTAADRANDLVTSNATDTVTEDVLVEEVSIDGMCGVY